MNTTECDREQEILEAVLSGRWQEGFGDLDDLSRHADACPICGDLVTVALTLRDERDAAWREARLPTSGQVWWRAAMRRRAEAVAAASRPITLVQGLAAACAAGVIGALITLAWPVVQQPLTAVAATWAREGQRIGAAALSAAGMQQPLLSLGAALGACLVLAPFLLYLVLSDD